MHARRGKAMWGHSKKVVIYKPGEASPETNPDSTFIWTSHLQNWKKINLCCLSHPVLGILLWQPYQTKTRVLWTEYIPLKFIFWNPHSQCDDIWKWSIWEVIRIRQGHESEALTIGLVSLSEKTQRAALCLCLPRKDAEKRLSASQEEHTHQNVTILALISDFLPLDCEKITGF